MCLFAASRQPGQTYLMVAPRRRRISTGVAAICGAFLLIPTVGAVEVESDPIEERTEAALADFRSAMKLEPNLQHGARLYTKCAACHAPNGLGTRGGSLPAIAAQHVSVLVKQLVDFRHDRRWGEQMRNVASQHYLEGPQELLDVASHA